MFFTHFGAANASPPQPTKGGGIDVKNSPKLTLAANLCG